MKWYVLQVMTGHEHEVRVVLERHNYIVVVPTEHRVIRTGGVWTEKEYTLMPGYVFVSLNLLEADYYIISAVPYVIKILPGDGKVTPLEDAEANYIISISKVRPSPVSFASTPPRVLGGILKSLEANIVKFDRHSRRAHVNLNFYNEVKAFKVSIYILDKAASFIKN